MPGITAIVSAALVVCMILLKLNTLGIVCGALYGVCITMAIPAFATVYLDIVPPAAGAFPRAWVYSSSTRSGAPGDLW